MASINALRPYRPATYSGKRWPPTDFVMRRAWRHAFRRPNVPAPVAKPNVFRRFLRSAIAYIAPLRVRTALSRVPFTVRSRRGA